MVKMYSTTWCGYCSAAKRLLDDKGIAYEDVDVTDNRPMRQWLIGASGRRTVPQIFIDGEPIGGYDELRALDRRGGLDRLRDKLSA